jgi:hypothetical protein
VTDEILLAAKNDHFDNTATSIAAAAKNYKANKRTL